MTTTNTSTNGRIRKSLAEQLDRLDQILDGLADGLNEAVATAVKEAVGLAVQETVRGILAEVLTNPELLAKLRGFLGPVPTAESAPVAPAVPTPKPPRLAKLAAKVRAWFGLGWQSVRQACALVADRIGQARSGAQRRWQRVRQFRVPLLTAVVVGAASGVAAYCGGPYVAAFAGWVAGFTTTLTVQAGIWLRRALDSFPAANA